MKRLWSVFEFELMSYVKNKSFMLTTIFLAIALFGATFLPKVIDMNEMLGIETEETKEESVTEEDAITLGLVDEKGYFSSEEILEPYFENATFKFYEEKDALEKAVETEEIEAGFLVKDDLNFEYFVLNREMSDVNQMIFTEVLGAVHKQLYLAEQGLDAATFISEYEAVVNCEENVLGKDAGDNFWYCYALVIVIFMVIVLYGVMIATAVTTEKSNRTVEVLVTSIDSTYLLFGKVFAGTVAVVIQVGLILGGALIGYSINHDAWGNKLDMILDIPSEVLIGFAIFGIGGFLFYAFLYGAMGALASKTEDINKTAGGLQMIIMIVYFVGLSQLENPDGMLMKVCSYLPISSYSTMFIRIGMGSVEVWEMVVSAVILYVSIFFAGWVAAKIYRMGTLRYGNPISFTKALKDIKNAE